MRKIITLLICLVCVMKISNAQSVENLVFSTSRWKDKKWLLFEDNNKTLYKIISNEAFYFLNERKNRIEQLHSKKDWIEYRDTTRAKMRSTIESFEKTPMSPKITGVLERKNFIVEKILFESQPGFYVTAGLFIPKNGKFPAPTVIYCAGHTDLGFRSEVYQRVIMNLVEKGFVVFAFDPIGQGERLQFPEGNTGRSKIGGPTTEHSYSCVQTLLTGTSLTDYFIWDAVRAIDYLETRKEVDIERLGVTGRSGGGLQTALLMAYDDRVYAAAPECYITNFRRLFQSIGAQDAEQNPYQFIKKGFDQPDFLHLHAPKPLLIITTTHDFFSIQGARESFSEAKKSYKALGFPDNINLVEDLGIHESTKNNREALYDFFLKNLRLDGEKSEIEVVPFSPEELRVTNTGQVETEFNGESVYSLNLKYFNEKDEYQDINSLAATKISGTQLNRNFLSSVYTGNFSVEGIAVDKHFIESDLGDYALPVYHLSKNGVSAKKLLVWLHPDGKEAVLSTGALDKILNLGYTVIAPDLPGIGELRDPDFRGDGFVKGVPFNYTFGANLVGKSIPGIQAESIDLLVQFFQQSEKFKNARIDALVEREMSSATLFFCCIKNPFNKIVFRDPVESNKIFVESKYYDPGLAYNAAPGSLPNFDFTDMVSLLPENKVRVVSSDSDDYLEILNALK